MNNNGKGNIIFILLIPVFIICVLVIVDTIISYTQTKTYKEVTERIIKEVVENEELTYEDYYDEIKRSYERRGYKTERLVVEADEYKIYVENEHVYFGLFTSVGKQGEEVEFTFFNIEYLTFKLKKNSKTFIKLEATLDENNKLEFEYIK